MADTSFLLLSATDVYRLLSIEECIRVVEEAFIKLSNGEAILPLRSLMRLGDEPKILGVMPSSLKVSGYEHPFFGMKVLSVFFSNMGTEYDSHQGVIPLFEGEHGRVVAIVEAGSITKLRTAASSAVATKVLARSDKEGPLICSILGAGHQAESHIEAMLCVRNINKIYIWSRTHSNAVELATKTQEKFNIETIATESIQEAVSHCDILCTTTASKVPLVKYEWIKPGCHINAVGASSSSTREIDSETVSHCSLYADRVESLVNEAGDYLFPLREGLITSDHIKGELGDLLTNKIIGRTSNEEITLFKSLGLSIEDIASAQYCYEKALRENVGICITNFAKI